VAYADLIRHQHGSRLGAILGHSTYQTDGGKLDPVTGQGKASAYWFAGACAAEVEVDTETGMIEILHIVPVVDPGKVIHPVNCRMQNEGSMIMALGSALFEELVFDNGQPINPTFLDYTLPTFMEMPRRFTSIMVETPHREGPWGAKGVGEVVLPSIAAAIGNAVYDAIGVRITDLPLTPERVLRAIASRRGTTA